MSTKYVYTPDAVREHLTIMKEQLALKANASTTYSKTEVDTIANGKADAATTYTKTEVDTIAAGKANANTTYSKTEVDTIVAASVASVYKPGGSCAFANLPALTAANLGKVVNVTDGFTSTADFVEGASKTYPAGSNVVIVDVGSAGSPSYKYDVLPGDYSAYALSADFEEIDDDDVRGYWNDINT